MGELRDSAKGEGEEEEGGCFRVSISREVGLSHSKVAGGGGG